MRWNLHDNAGNRSFFEVEKHDPAMAVNWHNYFIGLH